MKIGKLILEIDSNMDEYEYDNEVEYITILMQGNTEWVAKVKGFGWRNLDANTSFVAEFGSDFLSYLLPNCPTSIRVYQYGKKGLAINCVHHDSPVWDKEWYYVVPKRLKKNLVGV